VVADLSGKYFKLDATTGKSEGQIKPALAAGVDVCGSKWSLTANGLNTSTPSTTLRRLNPANGNVLASFTVPGEVESMQQIGDECWAAEWTGVRDTLMADDQAVYRFIRITPTGIDRSSPTYPTGTDAAIFDGTFWVMTSAIADPSQPLGFNENMVTTMQRIDPATWQPTGTAWTYTGSAPAFSAGGSLWAPAPGGASRLSTASTCRLAQSAPETAGPR
jgi:hypothetical protein